MATVLIASSDRGERATLSRAYRISGHTVLEAADAAACLELLGKKAPDALVLDPRLEGLEASRLLRAVRRQPELAEMRVSLLAHDMDPKLWEFLGRQFFDLVVEESGAAAAGVLAAGETTRPAKGPRTRGGRKTRPPAPEAPRRVLVVEDEPTYALLLGTEFRSQGWIAVGVESAEAALAWLQKDTVDAVLSDVKLPGMNGCDLAFALHEKHPAVKVVLMTGMPRDRVPKPPRDVPVLPKPISVRQLMAAMRFL